jgi:hypothetical protein
VSNLVDTGSIVAWKRWIVKDSYQFPIDELNYPGREGFNFPFRVEIVGNNCGCFSVLDSEKIIHNLYTWRKKK